MKYLVIVSLMSFILIGTACASTPNYSSSNIGLVKHAVFFKYRSEVEESSSKLFEIRQKFLKLKHMSLKNGLPYIVSIDYGQANSEEGVDLNMTDGFILTFKSTEDRDFYVGCNKKFKCSDGGFKSAGLPYDLAHDDFKTFVGPLLYDGNNDGSPVPEGVFVFDFISK